MGHLSTRWTWRAHTSEWGQLSLRRGARSTVSTDDGLWVVPPHQAVWVPARVPHESRRRRRGDASLYVRPPFTRRLPSTCRAVYVSPLLRELLRRALQLQTLDRTKRDQRNLMEMLLDELAILPVAPIDLPMPRDARALRAARHARATSTARTPWPAWRARERE